MRQLGKREPGMSEADRLAERITALEEKVDMLMALVGGEDDGTESGAEPDIV